MVSFLNLRSKLTYNSDLLLWDQSVKPIDKAIKLIQFWFRPSIYQTNEIKCNFGFIRRYKSLYKHFTLTWIRINVKKFAFGNKEHTTDQEMGVSVLLRHFISSNEP